MAVLVQLLIVGALTGAAAIILGGVLGFLVLPDDNDEKLVKNVRLELPEAYRNWENLPYDITTKFYFFDVKNSEGIMNGVVATLDEKGPTIYKQGRHKENILYDPTDDSFSYTEYVTNIYSKDSEVKETDTIITLNVLKYLSLLYANEAGLMDRVKNDLQYVFKGTDNNNLFHRISIKDLLVDGYESCRTSDIPSTSTGGKMMLSLIISKLKNNPRFKKNDSGYLFHLFRQEQNYTENSYEMYGGFSDISKQGSLKSINGEGNLTFWPEIDEHNHCNLIRGTDSYTFPPNIDVDSGFSIFDNNLCRSVDYAFTEEVEVREMTGQRLILKSENFAPVTEIPSHQCFCVDDDNTKCPPTGMVNIVNCYDEIPIIASLPHFMYAEPKYYEPLKFTPTVETDVSFFDIQVESGSLLRRTKRTQYNIWVKPIPGFAEKIKSFILPLFWIEETMEIPDTSVKRLNEMYFDDLSMIEGVKWGLLGGGAGLLLGCAVIFIFHKLKLKNKA